MPNEGGYVEFVNADLIAAGLSPFNADALAVRAGRLMLARIDELASRGESFAFETTLSGRSYIWRIRKWREAGFDVRLIFLRLPSADAALERVRLRVQEGGHGVAESIVRRRHASGWRNFQEVYRPLVNSWTVVETTDLNFVIIDEGNNA